VNDSPPKKNPIVPILLRLACGGLAESRNRAIWPVTLLFSEILELREG